MTSSDDLGDLAPRLAAPLRARQPLVARVLLITDGVSLPAEPALSRPAESSAPDPQRVVQCLTAVLSAVPPGSIAVQLRSPRLSSAALYERALWLRDLTARHGAPLLINDRVDVALAVGADGVHLPGHGLPAHSLRRWLGSGLQICAAAHSVAEARLLAQAGADAVTLSPIWPTPSKPALPVAQGGVQPLGQSILAQAVRQLAVPVFALGGIDSIERAAACASLGARIACLRALVSADPKSASARAVSFVAAMTSAASTGSAGC